MDYKYISQLLDRYWQGETTLEEEQILRSFFSQLCIPEELQKYRSLFIYEQTEKHTNTLGDDFDERMMALIDEPETEQAPAVSTGTSRPAGSVALNDSARIDTLKKSSSVDAVQQPLIENGAVLMK